MSRTRRAPAARQGTVWALAALAALIVSAAPLLTSPVSAVPPHHLDAPAGTASPPPTAQDDEAATYAGSMLDIDVLANDDVPDGLTLTVSDPSHGTASVPLQEASSRPMVEYVADQNAATGVDTFRYDVRRGDETVASAQVSVFVFGLGDLQQTITRRVDLRSVTFAPLRIPGVDLRCFWVPEAPLDGQVDGPPGAPPLPGSGCDAAVPSELVYTAESFDSGEDTFTYAMSDGDATVAVDVTVALGEAASPVPSTPPEITEADPSTPAVASSSGDGTDPTPADPMPTDPTPTVALPTSAPPTGTPVTPASPTGRPTRTSDTPATSVEPGTRTSPAPSTSRTDPAPSSSTPAASTSTSPEPWPTTSDPVTSSVHRSPAPTDSVPPPGGSPAPTGTGDARISRPGHTITVTGGGCDPGDAVLVTLDGSTVSRITADRSGGWANLLTAPEQPGRHEVQASCRAVTSRTVVDVVLTADEGPGTASMTSLGLLAGYALFGGVFLAYQPGRPRSRSVPTSRDDATS